MGIVPGDTHSDGWHGWYGYLSSERGEIIREGIKRRQSTLCHLADEVSIEPEIHDRTHLYLIDT